MRGVVLCVWRLRHCLPGEEEGTGHFVTVVKVSGAPMAIRLP